MKLQDKIYKAYKEYKSLTKQRDRNNKLVRKRWGGKFVKTIRNGSMIEFEMLPLGLRELTKFNIEYVKDGFENSDEWMWENKGISYEPDDCFCMICHSHNVVANVQYGIAPRFATCPKHIDFLTLGYQLRKDKEAV